MKTRTRQNQIVRRVLVFTVLLAGTFWGPSLSAQPAAAKVDNRLLLIFDIASDMKPRVPAVQEVLNDILVANTNGQLHSGDSIGVWTFDQDLHVGKLPLQNWLPETAPTIASNITSHISKVHYSKKTSFDALQPLLNRVVQSSERLTVLIFCDGKGEIHGTPYDLAINQVFAQRRSERQEQRLPFVIGLRSQRGQYVGCMVSFPPQPVSLPEFPPLPEVAPAVSVADVAAPPRLPQPSVPSLIIVGTNITDHVPPPQPKPAPTSVTSTSAPVPANEAKSPDVVPLVQTNAVPIQTSIITAPLTPAKAATPPPESRGFGHNNALVIGAAMVVAFLAGGLLVFMLRRARKPGGDNPGDSTIKKV